MSSPRTTDRDRRGSTRRGEALPPNANAYNGGFLPNVPASRTTREGLVRAVGRWDVVALTVNGVIGAGIFGLPAAAFAQIGVYSLLGFVVCGMAVMLITLCFAEVSSRFQRRRVLVTHKFVRLLDAVRQHAGQVRVADVTEAFGVRFQPGDHHADNHHHHHDEDRHPEGGQQVAGSPHVKAKFSPRHQPRLTHSAPPR